MYDAVVTYHTDPWTCGTAKFNRALAAALGVPLVTFDQASDYARPLWSIKPDEFVDPVPATLPYGVLLHAVPRAIDGPLLRHAVRVYAANHAIADAVTAQGVPARFLAIPPLLDAAPDPVRLVSFGMAHKLVRPYHERVRDLLGDRDYTVELSVLVHEGQPWGGLMQRTEDAMRDIYGDHAHVHGSLVDAALRRRLRRATYALLFYPGGARSNNTSLWAALQEGAHVITNLDPWSPAGLTHGVNCYDIERLDRWPDHPPCGCAIPTLADVVEALCEP